MSLSHPQNWILGTHNGKEERSDSVHGVSGFSSWVAASQDVGEHSCDTWLPGSRARKGCQRGRANPQTMILWLSQIHPEAYSTNQAQGAPKKSNWPIKLHSHTPTAERTCRLHPSNALLQNADSFKCKYLPEIPSWAQPEVLCPSSRHPLAQAIDTLNLPSETRKDTGLHF